MDDFVKLGSTGTRSSNEFNKEIYFRYRANKSVRQSGIASTEKPSASPIGESLGRKKSLGVEKPRVEAEVGIEMEAMLVEFQIPIANWEQGVQRLRKLGMVLPEKLPTVEYLEFTAIPIPGTNRDTFFNAPAFETPIDRFVVDMTAAKVEDLSQWQFSGVDRLEKVTQSKSEIPAKEPVAKDKKENRPSSSTIRIRVRPIR